MKVKLVAHLPGLSEISNSLERHSRCLLLLGEGVANLPRSGVEKGGGGGGGCANANAHFRDGASRAKLHCLGRVCAERSEIVRIFNEARAKRVKRVKRIKWNSVSLVLDVAFMPVAISRTSSRVCSSSSRLARFARSPSTNSKLPQIDFAALQCTWQCCPPFLRPSSPPSSANSAG